MRTNNTHKYYLLFVIFLTLGCERNSMELYDVVIKNVKIIDEKGEIWPGIHSIGIGNGSINKILESNMLSSNAYSQKWIDGSGKYLLPGFWDNHVHFRTSAKLSTSSGNPLIAQNEKFLKWYIAHGITTVRDAGGDLTPQVQQWNQEIAVGKRIGPTIYTSGPKIDGPNARWEGSVPVDGTTTIQTAVDSLEGLGIDYIKLYDSTISGDDFLAVITEAEQRDILTSGHMPFTVELQEAIDAGLDGIEHLYYILKGCSAQEAEITAKIKAGTLGFWGSMEQLIATYDESIALKIFAQLKENKVFVTPTLHIGEVLSYLDEVDHTQDRPLQKLDAAFVQTYQGRIRGALNASAKAKSDRKALQQFFNELAYKLQKAGVGLLGGSDCGAYNSYVYPGSALHEELAQLVKAGLSPQEALMTSAYHGAQFLRKEGVGIAIGNRADLVILEANPLEAISNTKRIHTVIKNGQVFDRTTLDQFLEE